MKNYLFLFIFFYIIGCANNKTVYWCGDHACINNKEKEAYFKKTMIIEKRGLIKQNKEKKSELEIIKKQAGLENEKIIKKEKKLTAQKRLEKKGKIKGKKELAKQARLEEKRRIKGEKELVKQAISIPDESKIAFLLVVGHKADSSETPKERTRNKMENHFSLEKWGENF